MSAYLRYDDAQPPRIFLVHESKEPLHTWPDGKVRFELKTPRDGELETIFYIKDATVEEAEQAIHAAAHVKHCRLVFEGNISHVEAFARQHGIEIIS